MITFRFRIAGILLVSLAGCTEKISDEDLICNQTPGLIVSGATTADEQVGIAKQCIHKWAYRLGRAPGSNTEVAKAVIGACREAIDRIDEMNGRGTDHVEPSLYDEYALYRVIQGRAGNCSIRGVDQK